MRTGHAARRSTRSETDPSLSRRQPRRRFEPRTTVDVLSVCMKHDHAGGITVLLVDLDVHACSLCTLAKFGEIPKPFTARRANGTFAGVA